MVVDDQKYAKMWGNCFIERLLDANPLLNPLESF